MYIRHCCYQGVGKGGGLLTVFAGLFVVSPGSSGEESSELVGGLAGESLTVELVLLDELLHESLESGLVFGEGADFLLDCCSCCEGIIRQGPNDGWVHRGCLSQAARSGHQVLQPADGELA